MPGQRTDDMRLMAARASEAATMQTAAHKRSARTPSYANEFIIDIYGKHTGRGRQVAAKTGIQLGVLPSLEDCETVQVGRILLFVRTPVEWLFRVCTCVELC